MAKSKEAESSGLFGPVTLHSNKFYGLCLLGGLLATGSTHWAITPLDIVKCQKQANPNLFESNAKGLQLIYKQQGLHGLYRGGLPTFFGYSFQGAGKYGLYEIFKKKYGDLVGQEMANKYKTSLYLVASGTAEFFADIFLCPFEATKIAMQTGTNKWSFSKTFKSIVDSKGIYGGLYQGIIPLWGRQIPYTMTKFASFENIVQALWRRMPDKKENYSAGTQIAVSFVGGYMAGILCALISHPADVAVTFLNTQRQKNEPVGACLKRFYAKSGFKGVWTGLTTRIFMIGTLTGLQWFGYDSFKVSCGIPTT